MPTRRLAGTPASPGIAVGTAWRLRETVDTGRVLAPGRREREREIALAALAAAARSLLAVAAEMAPAEAAIVEAGALMAEDPVLLNGVEEAIRDRGLTAAAAILAATEEHAEAISRIGDETLAARADDVRSLGRRAARLTQEGQAPEPPSGAEVILIARDLGPADVAELAPGLGGVALASGGATAHAAIVARSLGIPMVTGLDESVLRVADRATVVLDGSLGELVLDPPQARAADARRDMEARRLAAWRAHESRREPAVTTDGVRMTVLANVASPEELEVALSAGAEGIGLLRTELAFLSAQQWPSESEHLKSLTPILAGISGRPAVVRVLDFGADKCPPFLSGVEQRGLELLLGHPDALLDQLSAILVAAQAADVRLLLPMVDTAAQVAEVQALIDQAAEAKGVERIPPLGAMIETPRAAENAAAIAERCAFLSIGTNDLTAATLGAERFSANSARPHHPKVLWAIARSVRAARAAGIPIEVCGEAASEPIMLPLLIGLGVDELSVGAARVGQVRHWVRQLDSVEAEGLAHSALTMDSAQEVEWAARTVVAALQGAELDPAVHAVGS